MALVRHTIDTQELPHEPGNYVTIRRVQRAALRDAAEKRQVSAVARVQALGGPSVIKQLRDSAEKAEAAASSDAPVRKSAAFDEDALILAGLVAITGPLYDVDGQPVAIDAALVADLDAPTAAFIAEAIAQFADGGALEKNG